MKQIISRLGFKVWATAVPVFRFNKIAVLLALIFLAVVAAGCGETAVPTPPPIPASTPIPTDAAAPRDGRTLSLDVTEAADNDFDAALQRAKAVGVTAVTLTVYWDEIETEPGVHNPNPNWLEIANLYYPTQEVAVSLTISVIDTNNLRLPSDLAGQPFDDPAVIGRFNSLFDLASSPHWQQNDF
ncbi:MAG TPA: hypothetical protein EYP41_18555 [Anaerolineae bacterium]|nr:hypothetical protein [Anaerolineae bacterium]HIP73007.1 hypothetical protein [Anaerolineae bacterium]